MLGSLKKAIPQKIFFIIFAGIPLLFSTSFYPSYYNGLKTYSYIQHECVLLINKRQKNSSEDYRRQVSYSYQYKGQAYVGSVYQHGMEIQSNNNSYVEKSFRKKKSGEVTECFINPNNPEDAVLVQGSIHAWYEVLFFSILLIFGVWGLFMSFFRPQWAEDNMIMDGDAT